VTKPPLRLLAGVSSPSEISGVLLRYRSQLGIPAATHSFITFAGHNTRPDTFLGFGITPLFDHRQIVRAPTRKIRHKSAVP